MVSRVPVLALGAAAAAAAAAAAVVAYFMYRPRLPKSYADRRLYLSRSISSYVASSKPPPPPPGSLVFSSDVDPRLSELLASLLGSAALHVTSLSLSFDFVASVTLSPSSSSSSPGSPSTGSVVSFTCPLLSVLVPAVSRLSSSAVRPGAYVIVSDASGGVASSLLSSLSSCPSFSGVLSVVDTSAFLPPLAVAAASQSLSTESLVACLQALFLLSSHMPSSRAASRSAAKTLVFPLSPLLSSVAPLLVATSVAFPHDRHLFAYDSVLSVLRRLRSSPSSPPLLSCVPLAPLEGVAGLPEALERLPTLTDALLVEAWLGAVDELLRLKGGLAEEDEGDGASLGGGSSGGGARRSRKDASQQYVPFVLRVDYLTSDDVSSADLAMSNLLQFVTGSRSRPLGHDSLSAAAKLRAQWRQELLAFDQAAAPLTRETAMAVDDCVFLHKQVLICDKTLPDTVQPKKEWSLKAARRTTGCGCCNPGDEDDDEDDDEVRKAGRVGGGAGEWRDGKSEFAFDPVRAMKRLNGGAGEKRT